LRSQNVYNDGLRLADVVFIDEQTHKRMAGTRVLPCDLLLNITGGSIGRCAKVPVDFQAANVSQHVAIIRVGMPGMEDFIHALILSPYFQSFVDTSQTGAGRGGLPKNRMDAIPVALPPIAEQHRIVARVDELMAFCDQLEAARMQREQCRERLVTASLQRLNQPGDTPEVFRSEARFALQVLPSLTTTPSQIKQLRETILNLAVRGKLVEQDPEDEPVAASLHQALAERQLKSRQFRLKPLTECEIDANNLGLAPEGWCHASPDLIANIAKNSLAIGPFGSNLLKEDYLDAGVPLVFVRNIRAESYGGPGTRYISEAKANELSAHKVESGDLLITKMGDPPGDTSIYPAGRPPAIITADCIKFAPNPALAIVEYLRYAIRSHQVAQQFVSITVGVAQQKVSLARFRSIGIPLPPLAEQHRIVAKIDELMALCDQLEQQLSQAEQSRRGLLEAVLQEALTGPERALIAAARSFAA
jgi:type I restriction enzyme S subunit